MDMVRKGNYMDTVNGQPDYARIHDAFVGDMDATDEPVIEMPAISLSLEERVAALERKLAVVTLTADTTAWLYAEAMHKAKEAAAARILADPAVKERLQQALIASMNK